MDTSRKRILFQLRLLDEREGRGQVNYDEDASTESLQRHYDERLDKLSKQQEEKLTEWEKERQEREQEMRRRVEEKERREKEEKARKEKEVKERMRMWRNTASVLGYDYILKNYSEENFDAFWDEVGNLYPELARFIQADELKLFLEVLSTMNGDGYTFDYLFKIMKHKSDVEELATKHFKSNFDISHPRFKSETVIPSDFKPSTNIPNISKDVDDVLKTIVEAAAKSPVKVSLLPQNCAPKTTVEITDAEDDDDILECLLEKKPIEVCRKMDEKRKVNGLYGEHASQPEKNERSEKNSQNEKERRRDEDKHTEMFRELGDAIRGAGLFPPPSDTPKPPSQRKYQGSIFDTFTQNDINNFMSSISGSLDEANPFLNLLNAYLVKPPYQVKK